MATKAEEDHMALVARMPCKACGNWPVVVHHAVNLKYPIRDHFRTVPYCPECHVGKFSTHMARKSFRAKYGHEDDHVIEVNNEIGGRL